MNTPQKDFDAQLNEIYYETSPIDRCEVTINRCKQFSLGMLYMLWLNEAMVAVDAKDPETLDPFTLFAEEFFDTLNPEVKAITIKAFRNMADALEYREKN